MNNNLHVWKKLLWITIIGIMVLSRTELPVAAQAGTRVIIHYVDISKFPDIVIWATTMDGTGLAITDLTQKGFTLKEDNAEKAINRLELSEVGIQLAIIVDASGSIMQRGATGKPRIEEVKLAIDELIYNSNKWINRDARLDWFSIIVPEKTQAKILSEPTNDYNALHNTMYLYSPPAQAGNTPMSDLLVGALQHLSYNPSDAHPQKAILIFSDGVDVVSSTKLDDAINLAAQSNIPIFSVLLGPTETDAARNLRRLSILTGGQYYHFQSFEALIPLFQRISSLRYQYQIGYRSSISTRSQHQITLELKGADEKIIASGNAGVVIPVLPPSVTIVEPVNDTIINRVTEDPYAQPEAVEPTQMVIQIQWTWPDGFPREIVKVELLINGVLQTTLTSPPFEQAIWVFGDLPSGTYALTARVTDELGLVGESDAATVQMLLSIPTPIPAEQAQVEAVQQKATLSQAIAIIAIAFAIGALILTTFLLLRKPQVLQGAMQSMQAAWKSATAPFQRRAQAGVQPKAYLEVIRGESSYQGAIPLYGEHNILGRDPQWANILFTNPTVSRLHCAIHERQPGVFYIEDRGGSGGTWVEDQQVTVSTGERRLNDGDIIELASVTLRFRLAPQQPGLSDKPAPTKDITTPYSPPGSNPDL